MISIKQLIEDNDTPEGFWFDVFIQILIVVSLVCFSIETLPNLSAELRSFLWYSQVVIVLIFTVEYLLRIIVADNKPKFIFSFSWLWPLSIHR